MYLKIKVHFLDMNGEFIEKKNIYILESIGKIFKLHILNVKYNKQKSHYIYINNLEYFNTIIDLIYSTSLGRPTVKSIFLSDTNKEGEEIKIIKKKYDLDEDCTYEEFKIFITDYLYLLTNKVEKKKTLKKLSFDVLDSDTQLDVIDRDI